MARIALAGAGVLALGGCLVALAVGGGAAPAVAGLSDPGPLVRWGIPVVRTVHDLAAALTIGLLVLATVAIPDAAKGVVERAGRLAVGSGAVWVVAGVLGVFLGFADIAGTSLSSPGFLPQFQAFVWSLETLREGMISSGVAAIAVLVAAVGTSRKAMGWAAALSLIALLPLALAGHAAATVEHETAVNALAFHLLGTALWVGGLMALALLRRRLGASLALVVRRYSAIAGWCFVAVGVSGVLGAGVRMASLADVGTAYGAIMLAKIAAFVVLGGFGFAHRRRVVGLLQDRPASKALFARLAAVEIAVMGLAVGIATALARTGNPNLDRPPAATLAEEFTNYPEPAAPEPLSWLTMWRWDWLWGTVAVLAIALYAGGVHRLHARGDRWPVLRTLWWSLGWVMFIWAVSGAPGVYGRIMFSWHMIAHMVIAMLVPILLVLGAPLTLVLRVVPHRKDGTYGPRELLLGFVHSGYVRFMSYPVVAAIVFFVSLVVFYYSSLFELALTTHTGHVLMVVHFLLSGYLFAWVLVGIDPGPPKWSPPLRLVLLFATLSFHAFFGIAIIQETTLLAGPFFGILDLPWVPDPLADQRLGGGIAWGIGEVPTLALALLVTLDWLRHDDAEARRHDRQADRDGDADLAAYNARLAAIAQHDADLEEAAVHRSRGGTAP